MSRLWEKSVDAEEQDETEQDELFGNLIELGGAELVLTGDCTLFLWKEIVSALASLSKNLELEIGYSR